MLSGLTQVACGETAIVLEILLVLRQDLRQIPDGLQVEMP